MRRMEPGPADVLIVGGGAAGCVLANRLSGAGATVLLIEAGRDTPPGAVPDDIQDLYPRSYYNDAYMWRGLDVDQGGDGRGVKSPFLQARVLGGGSSVMGMMAVRGLPADYDGWGVPGWSWSELLPYFRRLETDRDFHGPLHGDDGPVTIRRHEVDEWPPFCRAVGAAAARRGWELVQDMNGEFGDGYCRIPISATLAGRVSSASAYLDASTRRRPNLAIEAETVVERLLFEGDRCVGATVVTKAGRREQRRARHVVLAAGAIHTPVLLQRSGVGPAHLLRRLGVTPVLEHDGVGANLQNHPVVYLATHLRRPARQSPMLRPQFNAGLRWSSGADGGSTGDMMMLVINKSSWHGLGEAVGSIGTCLMAPHSRGSVEATSPAFDGPGPDVRFRMLTDPRDLERMVGGLRLAVELMSDDAVRALRDELFAAGVSRVVRRLNRPGLANLLVTRAIAKLLDGPDRLRHLAIKHGIAERDVDEQRMRTRAWAQETVRRRTFGTYHVAGTCRMGDAGDGAVVDARCAVHGLDGVSVVDASIMPTVPRGNTNIPTVMLAERAADLLTAE